MLRRRHEVEAPFAGDVPRALLEARQRLLLAQFDVVSQSATSMCARNGGRSPRTSTYPTRRPLAGASEVRFEFSSALARASARLSRPGWQLRVFLEPQLLILGLLAVIESGSSDAVTWTIAAVASLVASSIIIACVESRARRAVDQLLHDVVAAAR